jgi:hypothetical protein
VDITRTSARVPTPASTAALTSYARVSGLASASAGALRVVAMIFPPDLGLGTSTGWGTSRPTSQERDDLETGQITIYGRPDDLWRTTPADA